MDQARLAEYYSSMTQWKRPDRALELGGLFTADGELARPLAPLVLRVPQEVSLAGRAGQEPDELWWTLPPYDRFMEEARGIRRGHGKRPSSAAIPGKDFLDRFLAIADGPAERIERFAERWGPLAICRHGLPYTHNLPHRLRSVVLHGDIRLEDLGCQPLGWAVRNRDFSESGREPLEQWRWFSRQANSLLRIASKLSEGEKGTSQDWLEILAGLTPDPHERVGAIRNSRPEQWRVLVQVLETWLEWGDIRPRITMAPRTAGLERPIQGMSLGGETLFGAIAVYLFMTVTQRTGVGICWECTRAFVPSRRLAAGRHRFCSGCGRAAALRNAATRHRERRARSIAMAKEGKPAAEIAKALGAKLPSVRSWISGSKVPIANSRGPRRKRPNE